MANLATRDAAGNMRSDVGGQVLRLDPQTDTVVQTLTDPLGLISSLGTYLADVQTDPATGNIYVAIERGRSDLQDIVAVFDPAGTFLRYVPLPPALPNAGVRGIDVRGGFIYASLHGQGAIARVADNAAGAPTSVIPAGPAPYDVTVRADGMVLVLLVGVGGFAQVQVVDPNLGTIINPALLQTPIDTSVYDWAGSIEGVPATDRIRITTLGGFILEYTAAGALFATVDLPGDSPVYDSGQANAAADLYFARLYLDRIDVLAPGGTVPTTSLTGDGSIGTVGIGAICRPIGVAAAARKSLAPTIKATANPSVLSPANNKMVKVTISGKICSEAGIAFCKGLYTTQDEYKSVQPKGLFSVKHDGTFSFTISLQAGRKLSDNDGRTYTVCLAVIDYCGRIGTTQVKVTVP